jgi:hypothetical protein
MAYPIDSVAPNRLMLRAAAIAVSLASASGAQAQAFIRLDCRPLIPQAHLDPSAPTARWYKRFWTGDCGDLHGCMGGAPNWNEAVGELVSRGAPAERPAILVRACRLGVTIGQEWTRPRSVRRIDTGDLRRFNATLGQTADVLTALGRVEVEVRKKIAGNKG